MFFGLLPQSALAQMDMDDLVTGGWQMKCIYHSDATADDPADDATGKKWYEAGYDDSDPAWIIQTGSIVNETQDYDACYYLRQTISFRKSDFNGEDPTLEFFYEGDICVWFNGTELIDYTIPLSNINEGDNTLAVYFHPAGYGYHSFDMNLSPSRELHYSISGTNLYVFCDRSGGDVFSGNNGEEEMSAIETITFDSSCSNYHPTSLSCLFYYFSNLKNIVGLQYLNTSNCNDMSNMFGGCSSLQSINLSNIDMSNVTNAGGLFYECSSLRSVSLPTDLSKVTNVNNMFGGCSSLQSINLSNVDMSSVTSAYEMFTRCSSLQDVSLPQNLSILSDRMFSNCGSLFELTIPSSITYISLRAFSDSNVKTLFFDKNITSVPENHSGGNGEMFACVPLTMIDAFKDSEWWDSWNILASDDHIYDVEVICRPTQLNNGTDLHDVLVAGGLPEEDFWKIVNLKIRGTINSYDVILMRNKMIYLSNLDLTEAHIVYNAKEYVTDYNTEDNVVTTNMFQGWTALQTVKLPNSIVGINESAFPGVRTLREVTIYDNCSYIGSGAFSECYNLRSVSLGNGLESIGDRAFSYCHALQQIDFPASVQDIGRGAFIYTGLTSITLPEGITTIKGEWDSSDGTFYGCYNLSTVNFPSTLTTIEGWAFAYCGIETLEFPRSLEVIGNSAFEHNENLQSIIFPNDLSGGDDGWVKLQSIGEGAFYGCSSLKTVTLPEFNGTIGNNAFGECNNITDYNMKWHDPKRNISMETFSNYRSANLHVAPSARSNYYWNTEWSQFFKINYDGEENDKWDTNSDNTIGADERYDAVDLNMNNQSAIIVNGETPQPFTYVYMKGDGDDGFASIIDYGNITVEKLFFDISVHPYQWYFYTFPFRVKVGDVVAPGRHVFRYYDGNERAANGNGGWKNLPEDQEYLEPGQGYIFQCEEEGVMRAEAVDPVFDGQDKANTITEYTSELECNAGWNLTGNPFPCYFDMNETGYTHPITIWNGQGYDTYRPGDDAYIFHPFEAFFVQKTDDAESINFPTTGRHTYRSAQAAMEGMQAPRKANDMEKGRMIVDLTLSNGTYTDRTRVVFNNLRKDTYESGDDAAKFFATGVHQLYTLDESNTCYAINERPLGDVKMGVRMTGTGVYTISAKRMDYPVLLKDLLTGTVTDLSEKDYQFEAESGTANNRFVLIPNTGINEINEIADAEGVSIKAVDGGLFIAGAEKAKVDIYQMNGTLMKADVRNGYIVMQKGVYLVCVNNVTSKVTVK